jgi:hypothetical protein
MLKRLLSKILIGSVIFLCGCVHTKHIGQDSSAAELAEMNRELNGREATIYLKDGSKQPGKDIQVNRDSTSWITLTQDKPVEVSTPEIERIVIIKRGRGALEGFCITAPIFAPFGALLGAGIASIDETRTNMTGPAIAGAALAGVGTGIVLGMPIGAAIGSKEKYIVSMPTDSSETSVEPIVQQ